MPTETLGTGGSVRCMEGTVQEEFSATPIAPAWEEMGGRQPYPCSLKYGGWEVPLAPLTSLVNVMYIH